MACFEVFINPGNAEVPYLLDVQCDLLRDLHSRLVVPLRPIKRYANLRLPHHLTPVFEIAGVICFMETPALAAVPSKILKTPLTSLVEHRAEITGALNFILRGDSVELHTP